MIKNKLLLLSLYFDYKLSTNRFAITDKKGKVLYEGDCTDLHIKNQQYGEYYALQKATEILKQIKEQHKEDYVYSILYTDSIWISRLNFNIRMPKLKAMFGKKLKEEKIFIKLIWVESAANLADKYTGQGRENKTTRINLEEVKDLIEVVDKDFVNNEFIQKKESQKREIVSAQKNFFKQKLLFEGIIFEEDKIIYGKKQNYTVDFYIVTKYNKKICIDIVSEKDHLKKDYYKNKSWWLAVHKNMIFLRYTDNQIQENFTPILEELYGFKPYRTQVSYTRYKPEAADKNSV